MYTVPKGIEMSKQQHTPTPWLVEVATVYAVHLPTDRLLADGETSLENRFFAHFNPGRGVSPDEARANAHLTCEAVNNHHCYKAALEAITRIAGNLTDEAVEAVGGINDARSRALMVITARQIAQNALAEKGSVTSSY